MFYLRRYMRLTFSISTVGLTHSGILVIIYFLRPVRILNERFCDKIRKAVGFYRNNRILYHAEAGRDAHL